MKKEHLLLIIFLIIILSAVILRLLPKKYYVLAPKLEVASSSEIVVSSEIKIIPETEIVTKIGSSSEVLIEPEINPRITATSSEVIITNFTAGGVISSPFVLEGRARGGWFFEATLPVKLTTEKGDIVLLSYGQAQSDWMTSDFVPFQSVLKFNTTATSGYLIISKDNPSGLPEHDAAIKIPVLFK